MRQANIICKRGKYIIDFPCPTFKNYLVGRFDHDGDGEISLEEARRIEYIDLWHCMKKSDGLDDMPLGFPIKMELLAGIEYFENLRGLCCNGCGIKGPLNLINNKRLTSICCGDNRITELILGEQPKLTCLDCGNNRIKELDISRIPSLAILHCPGNLLRTLDLSRNPKLEELDCSNNRIKSPGATYCHKIVFH